MAESSNFVELADEDELMQFLNDHQEGCVITFSATWCGPCKASKPKLKSELAPNSPVPIGYVQEEDIDDFLQVFVEIKAFPTYVYFQNGKEKARVQGVDLPAVEQMIQDQQQKG
ncbi:thioredoxin [Nitzschia inconspicua]|uniref:Thioredoxin n=1 Tax=Nitzschia inconspicua TaxID=303405 RepID=A0A9K3LXW8_9STRA|nr:thioredoxin [Nitzschia inconspicua]